MISPEHLIKNVKDTDYTDLVRKTYHLVVDNYGYSIRITRLIELLETALGSLKFRIIDHKLMRGSEFESHLLDVQYDFINGKDIDFNELYNYLVENADFLESEKRIMRLGKIEEVLWGILLAVIDPQNSRNI